MLADRTETNNIATEHPDVVEDLGQRYEEWAERCQVIPRDKILERMRNRPNKAFWVERVVATRVLRLFERRGV